MAGRAGRRGKDDRGFSLIMVDPEFGRIASNDEFKEMFDNAGLALESKLRLDYRACLNVAI